MKLQLHWHFIFAAYVVAVMSCCADHSPAPFLEGVRVDRFGIRYVVTPPEGRDWKIDVPVLGEQLGRRFRLKATGFGTANPDEIGKAIRLFYQQMAVLPQSVTRQIFNSVCQMIGFNAEGRRYVLLNIWSDDGSGKDWFYAIRLLSGGGASNFQVVIDVAGGEHVGTWHNDIR